MVRTRVGYAGGTKANPTYRSIGDHAEAIQIDFDPTKTSYRELIELFWKSHNACVEPWSRQYMSAVFWHDEAQRKIVEETAARVAKERGDKVHTEIAKLRRFYLAEDYHQKYRLRGHHDIAAELLAVYPKLEDFVNSTAAMRLNAWLGGYGTRDQFEAELTKVGLSERAIAKLRSTAGKRLR